MPAWRRDRQASPPPLEIFPLKGNRMTVSKCQGGGIRFVGFQMDDNASFIVDRDGGAEKKVSDGRDSGIAKAIGVKLRVKYSMGGLAEGHSGPMEIGKRSKRAI